MIAEAILPAALTLGAAWHLLKPSHLHRQRAITQAHAAAQNARVHKLSLPEAGMLELLSVRGFTREAAKVELARLVLIEAAKLGRGKRGEAKGGRVEAPAGELDDALDF